MLEPTFTTEAYHDLFEIVSYIASRDTQAATRLRDEIDRTCWLLAENTGVGQSRDDIRPGIRFFPIGNYLVFYRAKPDGAQILRVIHGARKYGSADFR